MPIHEGLKSIPTSRIEYELLGLFSMKHKTRRVCHPSHNVVMDAKDKARAKYLYDNYKLTIEMYERIAEHQGYVCYVCALPEPVKGRRLAVDHDHTTGEVRGLLCSRCNPALGKLERAFVRYGIHKTCNFISWFTRLAEYARTTPAEKALGYKHFGWIGRVGTKAHRARLRKAKRKLSPLASNNARMDK
jgi:hypothetical protein